eukprot:6854475-Alexandrium_andersonii.AAC.1
MRSLVSIGHEGWEIYDSEGPFIRRRSFLSILAPGPFIGGRRRRKVAICEVGWRRKSGDRFPAAAGERVGRAVASGGATRQT